MKETRISIAALLMMLLVIPVAVFGYNVRLSQIDASRLLLSQTVRLYVSVTDDAGVPVEGIGADSFSVFESADGQSFDRI